MVFFTCNHCGDSVKKPAVEKHYNTRCRGAPVDVSCMDCLQDFRGDAFVAHTQCISEAEKYSGKDYVPKQAGNKGTVKQKSWMDTIRAILTNSDYKLSANARRSFEKLQSVDNVPRKKAKFENFVQNSMHMPKPAAEEVWRVLEMEQQKIKQQTPSAAKTNGVKTIATQEQTAEMTTQKRACTAPTEQNGQSEASATKKLKREKATNGALETTVNGEETSQDAEENAAQTEQSFEWATVLEKIVAKNAEAGIALEKLKRKVLKKYAVKMGVPAAPDALTEKQLKKFEKKFDKNLKRCVAVRVSNELVLPS